MLIESFERMPDPRVKRTYAQSKRHLLDKHVIERNLYELALV